MSEDEAIRAAARAKALRGVSGQVVPNPGAQKRAPTPPPMIGVRAAADEEVRRA